MATAEAAALQQLLALGGVHQPQRASPASGGSSYRSREPTAYRGVTKTSGTNSGLQKFDVQFVFCDNGTKKHPKIYGFSSLKAAARAFDILTCKRALEKGRTAEGVIAAGASLGTNHPAADYADRELLTFLEGLSRDDCIYGLKQCAKKGHLLQPGSMLEELQAGIEAARVEAADRQRMGDPRQSYEVSAKASERRRRSNGGNTSGAAAAATAPTAAFQPQAVLAAAAAAAAAMAQQPFGILGAAPVTNGGLPASLDAATLTADDIVGQLVRATPAMPPPSTAAMAAMAAAAAANGGSLNLPPVAAAPNGNLAAPTPPRAPSPPPAKPSATNDEQGGDAARPETSDERSAAPPEAAPEGAAAPAVHAATPEPAGASVKVEEANGVAGSPAADALDTSGNYGHPDSVQPNAGNGVQDRASGPDSAAAAPEVAACGDDARGQGLASPAPAQPPADALATAAAAAAVGAAAASAQQQQQQAQHLPGHQQLLAQLLQRHALPGAAPAVGPASARLAAQGLPLLLEMLRISSASSQEVSCAHDIVRIWAAVHQGQNWMSEQTHLPRQYYQDLVPVLQACPDTASVLALASQLWQSGMLRMLCNAYTASLTQQASALALLQGASAGGAAAAAVTGLSQLTTLLSAATGGLVGGLPGIGLPAPAPAAPSAADPAAALAAALQGNPALAALLGQSAGAPTLPLLPTAGVAAALPATAAPAAVAQAAPQAAPQAQPTGRPQRAAAARPSRLSRQPSADQPPAKRTRRGGSVPPQPEPAPPPQLQQLLDILSTETMSPRAPAEHLLSLRGQEERQQDADDDMADAHDAHETPQQAQQQERGAAPAAKREQGEPQPAPVSAFAAAAAAAQAGQDGHGLPTGALAAAAVAAHHRSQSLQRSLSSQLPLPPNQPSVRIVTAVSRDGGEDTRLAASAAGASKAAAHVGGNMLIEVSLAAPPPLQHTTSFAAASRGGATITTGLNRAPAAPPPPVTTSAPASGSSEGGVAGAAGGEASANGGSTAAATPAAPPTAIAGTAALGAGKGSQARPHAASAAATITTGISPDHGSRPAVRTNDSCAAAALAPANLPAQQAAEPADSQVDAAAATEAAPAQMAE